MKKLNSILLFSVMLLLGACGENQGADAQQDVTAETENYQDPQEAMEEWEQAWNNNEPQRILEQTADDAVLLLNGTEVSQDSISTFLQENGAVMRDLQQNSLQQNAAERLAYDTGTFSHGTTADTTMYRGSYTFIWERAENDSIWKIKVMNISGEHPAMEQNQP